MPFRPAVVVPAGLAIASTVLVSVACSQAPPPSARPDVVLGAVYSLAGSQATLDSPSWRGAQLAAAEANSAGGVLGRSVRLELVDGESDLDLLRDRTAALLESEPGIAALVGLSDTDAVLAAAPVAVERGIAFLTSGATSPRLPTEVQDVLFLACFGDNVQAAAAAEWARESLDARRAVVLFDESMAYTRLLHGYFETRFTEIGGEVSARAAFDPGAPAAGVHAVASALDDADVVYLAAGPGTVEAGVRALRAGGYAGPILGGDGFDSPEVWAAMPDAADVYFTTHADLGPANPSARIRRFRAAYTAAYGGAAPDAFSALGYDAVRLLLVAVSRAGTDEPRAVLRALGEIQRFDGLTGQLSYPPGERVPLKSVAILRVRDGATALADVVTPREVPAP